MIKFILTLILLASTLSLADEKIGDQVRRIGGEDREMLEAIKHARSTLGGFLEIEKNPSKGSENFRLKVMLSDENGVEHLWFTPFKKIKGGFAGVLANNPETVKSVEFGKVYAFKQEQITDWGYELNGKQVGSFTICVLFKSMDPEAVKRYKKDHGFECKI